MIMPSNVDWTHCLDALSNEKTLFIDWQRTVEVKKSVGLDQFEHQILNLNKTDKKSTEIWKSLNELRSNYHLVVSNGQKLQNEIDIEKQQIAHLESKLSDLNRKYQAFAADTKELHQAYLAAKKHYQMDLNMYYTIETTTDREYIVTVHFFSTTSKQSENTHQQDFMLKLARQKDNRKSILLDMKPKPDTFKSLQDRLLETNDAMGLLCSARKYFKSLKSLQVMKKI